MLDMQVVVDANGEVTNRYLPKYMIAKLKYKCSVTLISLLEARVDNEIVSRMMKSLHQDILKRNIVDIYHMYEEVGMKKYTPEIFLHFDEKVDENEPDSLERASFIIETGFNLYIILSNYMEVSPKDGPGVQMSVGDEEGDKDLMVELTNSIIGKVIILAIDIVQSVRETIEENARKMAKLV